jgi:membrane associated rhomboid family serine protease
MSKKNLTWRIQHRNSASLVRSFVVIGLVTSAVCLNFIISENSNEYLLPLVLAITLSTSLPLIFLRKYYKYKKNTQFIILNGKSLAIPTPMMRVRMTDLSKIKSFEILHSFNSTKGLLIGLSNGSIEFIDAKSFECPTAFRDFTEKITSYTAQVNLARAEINAEELNAKRINHNLKGTLFLILIISSIYLITKDSGTWNITAEAMEIGALTKDSLQFQDFYRIGSSFFLHTNFNHFFLNIVCLALLGPKISTALGNFRFSAILFGSALAGSISSLLFSNYEFVIGASGGIMGLMGAYAVICLKYQNCIPGSASASAQSIIFSLLLQIAFDIKSEEVDGFSHAGGTIFGILYGMHLCRNLQMRKPAASLSPVEPLFSVLIGFFYLIGFLYFFSGYLIILSSRVA